MALSRITVLISGRGSNLAALIAHARGGHIAGAVTQVISNRAGVARGLISSAEATAHLPQPGAGAPTPVLTSQPI